MWLIIKCPLQSTGYTEICQYMLQAGWANTLFSVHFHNYTFMAKYYAMECNAPCVHIIMGSYIFHIAITKDENIPTFLLNYCKTHCISHIQYSQWPHPYFLCVSCNM